MIEIATVAAAISSANGLVELTKKAIELSKKEKNSPELIELIQDIREKAQDIKEENLDLRHQLTELQKRLDISSNLEFDKNNLLWHGDGDDKKGPYCSQCWDSNDKLIHLHRKPRGERGSFHQCPTCNSSPDIHTLSPVDMSRVNNSKDGW